MSEPTPESTLSRNPSINAHGHRPVNGLAPVPVYPSRLLSRLVTAGLCVLALLPLLALFIGRTPGGLHWLAALAFWAALVVEAWRFRRSQRALPQAVACESGHWQLVGANGVRWDAEPVGAWHLWHCLQILRLRELDGGRRWTLLWLPDSAGAEDRRRLRVWLRLKRRA